tara:strand:- start:64 stop:228 length:165 start_codon:yes stop_codon:yes gene_type:complete
MTILRARCQECQCPITSESWRIMKEVVPAELTGGVFEYNATYCKKCYDFKMSES